MTPHGSQSRALSKSNDLRHSYAALAMALGGSLSVIGRLLGHARVRTTAKYAHLVLDAEKAAAARTGDRIGSHIMPDPAEAACGGWRWQFCTEPSPT